MNAWMEDYETPPPITEEEEARLWKDYIGTGSDEARDRLIEVYFHLVIEQAERMAKKFPTHLDVQDLISFGSLGLMDAVRKFNPNEQVRFSTYCNLRINGSILDELRRLDWPSRQLRQKANLVKRAREELERKLGRTAQDHELADHLGLDGKGYNELMRDVKIKSMVSLDSKWDDDDDSGGGFGPIQMLQDDNAVNPLTELIRAEIKEVALRGLSSDEKKVLILYYYENLNLKEIGEVLRLSESRVCQIHNRTLEFLREKFTQRQITPHVISGGR